MIITTGRHDGNKAIRYVFTGKDVRFRKTERGKFELAK